MIVPIISLKGGVGKSTISLNFSYVLSEYKKTLLIDTDPQNSLATFLCSDFKIGFSEILFDRLRVLQVVKKPISENENFMFIPSGMKGLYNPIHYEELFLPEIIKSVFDEIKNINVNFTVFDTPPRISKHNETLIKFSDYLIIITTPDPASFASLFIFLEYLKSQEIDNYFVIVNKVRPDKISEDFNLVIQEKVKDKIIGFIPEDSFAMESEGMCEPAVKANPQSPFSIAVKEAVHEFMARLELPA